MNSAHSERVSEISDKELASKAGKGDASAFSLLSDRYMPILKSRANRYSNVVGIDTEDFIQEGLIALFKAAKGFDGQMGIQFSTYAVTCINNSMATAIKKHIRSINHGSGGASYDGGHDVQNPSQASQVLVEDLYIMQEDSALLSGKIQSLLSGFEQQVLRSYLRGNSYLEISGMLSTSTKAVDNALQRVRRKLRPLFGQPNPSESALGGCNMPLAEQERLSQSQRRPTGKLLKRGRKNVL